MYVSCENFNYIYKILLVYSLNQNYQTSMDVLKLQNLSGHPLKPLNLIHSLETEMENSYL